MMNKVSTNCGLNDEWSKKNFFDDCILNLIGTAFKVRAVIPDSHSVNVKRFFTFT